MMKTLSNIPLLGESVHFGGLVSISIKDPTLGHYRTIPALLTASLAPYSRSIRWMNDPATLPSTSPTGPRSLPPASAA